MICPKCAYAQHEQCHDVVRHTIYRGCTCQHGGELSHTVTSREGDGGGSVQSQRGADLGRDRDRPISGTEGLSVGQDHESARDHPAAKRKRR